VVALPSKGDVWSGSLKRELSETGCQRTAEEVEEEGVRRRRVIMSGKTHMTGWTGWWREGEDMRGGRARERKVRRLWGRRDRWRKNVGADDTDEANELSPILKSHTMV
jgi:hypothetical protein